LRGDQRGSPLSRNAGLSEVCEGSATDYRLKTSAKSVLIPLDVTNVGKTHIVLHIYLVLVYTPVQLNRSKLYQRSYLDAL
jgi:hypothetical protein